MADSDSTYTVDDSPLMVIKDGSGNVVYQVFPTSVYDSQQAQLVDSFASVPASSGDSASVAVTQADIATCSLLAFNGFLLACLLGVLLFHEGFGRVN